MSATLIDVDANAPSTPQTDKPTAEPVAPLNDLIEAVPDAPKGEETTPTVKEAEPELPDKYKGKSIQEIVEMHQNAEKLAGRQSAEVGELRHIVDDFITHQTQSTKQTTTEPEAEEEIDLFDDPKGSINKLIDNHPSIKEAREQVATAKQRAALDALNSKHSDIPEVLADPQFKEWIEKSSYRTKALVEANANYDAEAADEIFSEWKSIRPPPTETEETTSSEADVAVLNDKRQQKQKASTGAIPGSNGDNRKLYRRSDLIKLKMENPDRYSELQPEIMAAYAEKRVIS
jgi:hypothetical protein